MDHDVWSQICESFEETARADSLTSNFYYKNMNDFWSKVNMSTNQSSSISLKCLVDVTEDANL